MRWRVSSMRAMKRTVFLAIARATRTSNHAAALRRSFHTDRARRPALTDCGDDLFREAREVREELGAGFLEPPDAGLVEVLLAGTLVQQARLQELDVIDPGHFRRDEVAEVRV